MTELPTLDTAPAALYPQLVGDIAGHFWVRNYQRGYRWGRQEIEQLLDDIADSEGVYYLQPVVVKRLGARWDLVDGQQRLTTLYLILRYIRRHLPTSRIGYSLAYETRPLSGAYLENPTQEHCKDNIDFFHIYNAAEIIREWFESQADPALAAMEFYNALAKRVYVIWYEAPPMLDSRSLFIRLNVGRIPLTDAELVKAVLLSAVSRPAEVAAQWDIIERDLRRPELWSFITGGPPVATHISLILDALSGKPEDGSRRLFHTFETLRRLIATASAEAVWSEVQDLHALVVGWYEDRDLFHKIGFLVATGLDFVDLVEPARRLPKSAFRQQLDTRIRDRLRLTRDELSELTYDHHYSKCAQVLLLMNIEAVRRRPYSVERFRFDEHVSRSWSLEHIDAQSAEPLNRAEQWTAWLHLHVAALTLLPTVDDQVCAEVRAEVDEAVLDISESRFRRLEEKILGYFRSPGEFEDAAVHHIANLALLGSVDNSVLNNSSFEVKRQAMLELDGEGSYIPPCTRNVFLKYYTQADAQQVHFWGPQDRDGYLDAVLDALDPYLEPDPDE